jgi:hypothetical protein
VEIPMSVLAHVGRGTFGPLELGPLLLVALAYLWRARTLAREGRPVPGARQAAR